MIQGQTTVKSGQERTELMGLADTLGITLDLDQEVKHTWHGMRIGNNDL